MRWLFTLLALFLVYLQARLWVGEGSLAQKARLEQAIERQQQENDRLQLRNNELAREVKALKQGSEAIEEKAREDLGMIRDGETFYMVVEPRK